MVPALFFYQLTLIALVWLCLMLQWTWPSDPAVCPTTPEPVVPEYSYHARKISIRVSREESREMLGETSKLR